MRVLFVSDHPHLPQVRGGLQTTTHDLCLALRGMGAEAAVLCGRVDPHAAPMLADAVDTDASLGYPVMRASAPQDALAGVADTWNASVVVVQSGTALAPMVAASLRSGRPTAVYLHNVEIHQVRGHLVPDPSLLYLANSDFTAQRWRVLCGLQCTVVPPLVRADAYRASRSGDSVFYVNPVPVKGVELMFALAARCRDLPFLVLESWRMQAPFRALCRHRAQQLGNITWREPTDDMRAVYAQARMVLMPSVWEESFGRTVIEAQVNGLPVLASNRGALPQLVGDAGITLDPHAPIATWEDALRRLYAADAPWRAASRAQGEAYAASAPMIVADFVSLLAAHAAR
ncbi:glycosyltransferase [Ramlibacter sp.]|uniref:glycosyltransferase n=1 Tax=Ramlibacter sp. TaxID=1917967 RepID=UPI002FCC527F